MNSSVIHNFFESLQLSGDAGQTIAAQWGRWKQAFGVMVMLVVLLTLVLVAIGWTCSALGYGGVNFVFVVLYMIGWLLYAFWPTHLVVTFVLGLTSTEISLALLREAVKEAVKFHINILKYILFGGVVIFGFFSLFQVGLAQGSAMIGLTVIMSVAFWFLGLKSKWPARIIVTVVAIALTLTFLEILFPGFIVATNGLLTLK